METTFKNPICSVEGCFGELDFEHPVEHFSRNRGEKIMAYPCKVCGRLYENHGFLLMSPYVLEIKK